MEVIKNHTVPDFSFAKFILDRRIDWFDALTLKPPGIKGPSTVRIKGEIYVLID